MADDGRALHGLLFPVGPRQRRALDEVEPELAFLALHRGLARGFENYARSLGAADRILAWIRLDDEPGAAELLWGGEATTVDVPVSDPGNAYAAHLDPDLRHRLGEHYTPHDLVDRVVGRLAGTGIVADPACGDGRFLIASIDAGQDPARIWGADLNPLAVMMARINVWDRLGRPATIPATRVIWGDFILQGAARLPFELERPAANMAAMPVPAAYVGNPPWVTWRNLSDGYRRAVADHLSTSRLHHSKGWAARVSAGQTDLCHIFVHDAMERVAPDGRLGFVLPRTIFKAPVGPGRVREGVTTNGRPYRFSEVWDCEAFDGVRADTVVAFALADAKPDFPVRWRTRNGYGSAVLSDPDDPASPWLTPDNGVVASPLRLAAGRRWTGLRGRGGINTGGGNAAFYVEVRDSDGDHLVIRNLPSRRQPCPIVEATVESTYIRPLLRGRDVQPGSARPSGYVLVPHAENDLRKPVDEAELARTAPRTYDYLLNFRDLLAGRKELARWPTQPWYALFRIGPYTAGCWRVVWPHSANGSLRAAVLAPEDRTVPDQKVVLVAFAEREPALFLAGLLNSAVVRAAASASGGLDASPNLVRRLVLPQFDPDDPVHRQIVDGLDRVSELYR